MSDDYEKKLAEWKAKHGITTEGMEPPSAEDRMRGEDSKSTEKDYCWRCAEQFPVSDMIVDTDPYIYDGGTIRADGYIPEKERYRVCKKCHDRYENEEGDCE